mgnify:CR=1 FL=1
MESTRQRKFARKKQKEMAEVLQREIEGLEQVMVSVQYVHVTADLGIARFYLTAMPEQMLPDIVRYLNEEKPALRKLMARRLKDRVKSLPQLEFFVDDTQQEAEKLERIFKDLLEERRQKYGSEDAGPPVNNDDYEE